MVTLDESYTFCRKLTFYSAKNFFFSFVFLPADQKKYINAYYSFCRIADDIADNPESSIEVKNKNFEAFIYLLDQCYSSKKVNHIMFTALQDTIKKNSIQKYDLLNLVAGVKQDIAKKNYNTFNELYDYCYKVASEVAFVCLNIFLEDIPCKETRSYGEKLGIALQLTNIIRDIKEDHNLGRRYIPEEFLLKFGITGETYNNSLETGNISKKLFDLAEFHINLAETYYKEAENHLNPELKKKVMTLEIIKALYSSLLQHIKSDISLIFRKKVSLSTTDKIKILIKTKFFQPI